MPSPDLVVYLLHQYGYIALFLVTIFEGPIITIIGALLAAQGYFSLSLVFVIIIVGDLVGDLLYYGLGYGAHSRFLSGFRKKVGLTPERLERLKNHLNQHGGKLLLFAKYSQTGGIVLPAAGAAHMPLRKFLGYNLLGSIPKTIGLMMIGYFFGYAYNNINSYLEKISLLIFGVVLLAILYFLFRRFLPHTPV